MAHAGRAGLLPLLALLAGCSQLSGEPAGASARGLSIGGFALGPKDDVGALVERLTARLSSQPVEIEIPARDPGAAPVLLRSTFRELGFGVDGEAVLRRAQTLASRTLDPSFSGLPLAPQFESHVFFERLAELKSSFDRGALPARYHAPSQSLIPHVPGRYLDLQSASDALWTAFRARAENVGRGLVPASGLAGEPVQALRVSVPSVEVIPRVHAEALGELAGELRAISEFSTRFRTKGDQATRAHNIAVAAAHLDGWILLPGDRLSFNQVVGERSLQNGFEESWQILDGEMVRGMGGGTCQVSSTLHAAALQAGLTVIEAYPHSRPLAYIDKGLDATVAWPFVDLVLQNPWPLTLVIQASTREGTLTLRFLAKTQPAKVRIQRDTREVVPFPRIVEVSRRVRGFKLRQEGIPGYEIQRVRYISPASGEPRREVQTQRYRPTPELYLVAPDFDLRDLPALPEGALPEGVLPEAALPVTPRPPRGDET